MEPPINISDLLLKTYKNRKNKKNKKASKEFIVKNDYSEHQNIIEISAPKEYYPMKNVKNGKIFSLIYSSVKLIGGPDTLYKVKKAKQRLLKGIK